MVRAVWQGTTIAESDDTVVVEGNHYFPRDAVDPRCLKPSAMHTICGWKGRASYFTIVVDGKENADAAWYYPQPKPAASEIAGRVAFWRGVKVVDDNQPPSRLARLFARRPANSEHHAAPEPVAQGGALESET